MEALLTHCSVAFGGHGNLFFVFFLGGLTGSLTHCLAMCGPVVACQAACGGTCGKKLTAAAQLPYHAGRFLMYGVLGFFASLLSRQLSTYDFWPMLTATLMVVAGLLFIGSSLLPNQHAMFITSQNNAFIRGVLMGFMPCGLLYAALMMAATIPHPLGGMVAMWCFVLGTMPALLMASSGAALIAQKWQRAMGNIGKIGLTLNGLTLIAMAVRIVR